MDTFVLHTLYINARHQLTHQNKYNQL